MRVLRGATASVPEGRCDRSLARSAWDSATQKSRPVGYGLIRAGVRTNSMIGVTKFEYDDTAHIFEGNTPEKSGIAMPDHTVPYGTVLSVGAFPGTSCQATIMLRDEIHSPRRGFN
jgi:hypothetical protein